MIQIDILTPSYNKSFQENLQNIPGRIFYFALNSLIPTLEYIVKENPIFETYLKVRSFGCSCNWKFSLFPRLYLEDQVLTIPIIFSRKQCFVLDIIPDGNSNEIGIQISFESISCQRDNYVLILGIASFDCNVSDEIEKIVTSISINPFIWSLLWRTFDKNSREVLPALIRVVSKIIKYLPENDQKIQDLSKICCSIRYAMALNTDPLYRTIGQCMIAFHHPNELSFIPTLKNNYYVTIGGVYSSDYTNPDAWKEVINLGFPSILQAPIPSWCLENDEEMKKFIASLVE